MSSEVGPRPLSTLIKRARRIVETQFSETEHFGLTNYLNANNLGINLETVQIRSVKIKTKAELKGM
jgi:hypothetical protein